MSYLQSYKQLKLGFTSCNILIGCQCTHDLTNLRRPLIFSTANSPGMYTIAIAVGVVVLLVLVIIALTIIILIAIITARKYRRQRGSGMG